MMTQKKKGIRASLATSYSRTLNRVFGRGGPPDLFGGSISKEPSSSEGVDGFGAIATQPRSACKPDSRRQCAPRECRQATRREARQTSFQPESVLSRYFRGLKAGC